MQILKYLFWLIGAAVLAVVAGVLFWVQDANRFKPEVEALIEEQTDVQVTIGGDLSWDLWPPLTLSVADVTATQDDRDITAAVLELKVDASAMWQDVDAWTVSSLELEGVVIADENGTSEIKQFALHDFRLNEPARFNVDFAHTANDAEAQPIAALVEGMLTFSPATPTSNTSISFEDTTVSSDLAEGVCKGDLSERANVPDTLPEPHPDDILPLDTLLTYNAVIDCELTELQAGIETFQDAQLNVTNVDGHSAIHLNIRDFLGGTMTVDVDIDATKTPVAWTIHPEVDGVDSQRLVDWSDRTLIWAAPLALTSSAEMHGNSQAELVASMTMSSEFDGGSGVLDVTKIKRQLMRLAVLTNRTDRVSEWPDLLNYESMTGQLDIKGPEHRLAFTLDNLLIEAEGTVDYLADHVDLLTHVTVHEPPEDSPITINPWLVDTPIPMRCAGSSHDPKCRLDSDAAKRLVAQALQRGGESGLRQKLEDKIDEKVPEEYKETARGILDLLGRALERD